MGLPWVRFDTNMPTHDKILALLSDPSTKRWQAAWSYASSIMWSGGHGTDEAAASGSFRFQDDLERL